MLIVYLTQDKVELYFVNTVINVGDPFFFLALDPQHVEQQLTVNLPDILRTGTNNLLVT
jgi:hypothetical protein